MTHHTLLQSEVLFELQDTQYSERSPTFHVWDMHWKYQREAHHGSSTAIASVYWLRNIMSTAHCRQSLAEESSRTLQCSKQQQQRTTLTTYLVSSVATHCVWTKWNGPILYACQDQSDASWGPPQVRSVLMYVVGITRSIANDIHGQIHRIWWSYPFAADEA